VAHAAEVQALRDRPAAAPVVWSEPEEAPRAADSLEPPPEVARLLADLTAIARGTAAVPLARAVPAGDAGESFLRASLLSLVGAQWAGEGIAGQLGALPLAVRVEGDGWPADLAPDLPGLPLARLTPGSIAPRGEP
jgi:hypothetical protein